MNSRGFDAKLGGEVEADETFIGGLAKNKAGNIGSRRGHGLTREQKLGPFKGKTAVFGVVQRDPQGKTRVRAQVVKHTKAHTLLPALRDHVRFGATVYTDASLAYGPLSSYGFEHLVIDHAVKYVEAASTRTTSKTSGRASSARWAGRTSPRGRSTLTRTLTSRCSGSTLARTTTRAGSSRP